MGFSLRGRRAGAPAQPPRPVEATEVSDNEATRVGVYLFALALFAVGAGAATGVWMAVVGSVGALTAVVAVLVGLALAGAVRAWRPSGSAWPSFGSGASIASPGRGPTWWCPLSTMPPCTWIPAS